MHNLTTNEIQELMVILMEECAEVSVEASKIIRFGVQNNKNRLELEIGDLMCMYTLVVEAGLVDPAAVALAANKKREKLKKWSNLNV